MSSNTAQTEAISKNGFETPIDCRICSVVACGILFMGDLLNIIL